MLSNCWGASHPCDHLTAHGQLPSEKTGPSHSEVYKQLTQDDDHALILPYPRRILAVSCFGLINPVQNKISWPRAGVTNKLFHQRVMYSLSFSTSYLLSHSKPHFGIIVSYRYTPPPPLPPFWTEHSQVLQAMNSKIF